MPLVDSTGTGRLGRVIGLVARVASWAFLRAFRSRLGRGWARGLERCGPRKPRPRMVADLVSPDLLGGKGVRHIFRGRSKIDFF